MHGPIINMLFDRLLGCPGGVTLGGLVFGILLWAFGAAVSRSLVTLCAVAAGTFVGLRVPQWAGWKIDGMGLGISGALVFGVAGYALHRAWIGVALAFLLTLLCGAVAYVCIDPEAILPSLAWNGSLVKSLNDLWRHLPPTLSPGLPIACVIGMTAGGVIGAFWPKLTRVMLYGLLGSALIVAMGWAQLHARHVAWPEHLTLDGPARMSALAALVLIGAISQWLISPEEQPVASRVAQPSRSGGDRVDRPSSTGGMTPIHV